MPYLNKEKENIITCDMYNHNNEMFNFLYLFQAT